MTLAGPLPSALAVDVTRTASRAVVRPKGVLDRAAGQPLADALITLRAEPVVLVDLSEVSQLDAAVVAMLLRLRQRGILLRCIDPSPAAERVLRATGASMVLGLSPG
jgi:anti-anti-sigma regulatory factor